MPEVAVDAYLAEINRLIEEGHFQEAIGHCRHLLKQFPRHVDTYRLLGKALLESADLNGARDVFLRVLSADPEDLVANAGIAIIHKEQNNLREAAWHMERALDSEPYNVAIRESLQDIVGRRDGLPPEELALTGSALARLYIRGELYGHAISDLREALTAEPERVDLQLLLAEALWRDGQRIDAAECSQRVLEKLPNSIKANAIMAEVCLATERAGDAEHYLRHVFELTLPTAASLTQDSAVAVAFSAEGSPPLPEKIMAQRLDLSAGHEEAIETADWINDLDFGDELIIDDIEPSWLGALQDAVGSAELPEDEAGVEQDQGPHPAVPTDQAGDDRTSWFSRPTDQLPGLGEMHQETDWEAWISESEKEEPQVPGLDTDYREDEEDVMGAMDERDWGEEEFPEAEDPQRSSGEESVPSEPSPDWLDELQDAAEAERLGDVPNLGDEDLPDWLREGMGIEPLMSEELEWLAEPDDAPERDGAPATEAGDDLPDWLREELSDDAAQEPARDADDLSWLDQIAAGEGIALDEPLTLSWEEPDSSEQGSFEGFKGEMPRAGGDADDEFTPASFDDAPAADWLEEFSADDSFDQGMGQDDVPEDLEEAMAWLEQLAAQQGAPLEELPTLSTEMEQGEADLADELASADEALDDEVQLETGIGRADFDHELEGDDEQLFETELFDGIDPWDEADEELEGSGEVDEAMTWLDQLAAGGDDADLAALSGLEDGPEATGLDDLDELPDDPELALAWLEGLADGADPAPETTWDAGEVVQEPATPQAPLDVVAARAEAEAMRMHEVQQPDAVDEAGQDDEMVEEIPDDPDEAMAWLEKLAARQGAPIDELPSLTDEVAAQTDELPAELYSEEEGDESWDEPAYDAEDALFAAVEGQEELDEGLPDWLALDDDEEERLLDWGEPVEGPADWLDAEAELLDEPEAEALAEPEAEELAEWQAGLLDEPEAQAWSEPDIDVPAELEAEAVSEPDIDVPAELEAEALEESEIDVLAEPEAEGAQPEFEVAGEEHSRDYLEEGDASAAEEALASGVELMEGARMALEAGRIEEALPAYQASIEGGENLSVVIAELENAAQSDAANAALLQTLGDAYSRNGQLQKALDAYRQALSQL